MRIYQSFKEMFSEVKRDVVELGFRVKSESVQNIQNVGKEYDMKEIVGYSYKLTNTLDYFESFTKEEETWLHYEFMERVVYKKTNPGEAWKLREEVWKPLLNEEGKFDYTYNERIRFQLDSIIGELKRHPNTRQAIITIFNSNDLRFIGGYRRIPCSLSYQFLLRKEYLSLVYNMRSCDVITHFKFDAALACMLLNYVADRLGYSFGTLIHNIGSLHMFRKDAEGIF